MKCRECAFTCDLVAQFDSLNVKRCNHHFESQYLSHSTKILNSMAMIGGTGTDTALPNYSVLKREMNGQTVAFEINDNGGGGGRSYNLNKYDFYP